MTPELWNTILFWTGWSLAAVFIGLYMWMAWHEVKRNERMRRRGLPL